MRGCLILPKYKTICSCKVYAPVAIKIIGFSIDTDSQKWRKAILEDNVPWKCYLLENDMHNNMIKKLGFEAIPMNFLVDRYKNILAQNTDIRKILKQIPLIETE